MFHAENLEGLPKKFNSFRKVGTPRCGVSAAFSGAINAVERRIANIPRNAAPNAFGAASSGTVSVPVP
jgi:hypothetical protein